MWAKEGRGRGAFIIRHTAGVRWGGAIRLWDARNVSSCTRTTPRFCVPARARAERSLQIPVRLTPPVLEDNIGESDAANRAEAPNRIPDWQYGVAVPIRRQAESSFSFLFEGQMDCRQGRLSLLKSPTGQGIGLLTKRAADAS
jgi:hypothetical protein